MKNLSSHGFAFTSLLILVILYTLTTAGFLGANPIGQTNQLSQPVIVPAGYAFSIWGPIYLFLLVFPFYQWIKHRHADGIRRELRIFYGINCIVNGTWLVAASYDWIVSTVVLILVLLYTLVRIQNLVRALHRSGNRVNFWTEEVGFSVYFGWITIATVLNITGALDFYAWDGFGWPDVNWAMTILLITAGLAAWISWQYKNIPYLLVGIWAFLALMVRHWESTESLAYLAAAVCIGFSLLILMIWRRKKMVGNYFRYWF